LDLDVQAKLLRVIETGVIERVGGEAGRGVDVRIVAATNKDLQVEVSAGKFREDLYYRLNVFPIRVPPLRERTEDIRDLVEHLAAVSAVRCGCPVPNFAPEALERLKTHAWPGNVRELANVVERLTIVGTGESLRRDDVDSVLGFVPSPRAANTGLPVTGSLNHDLDVYEAFLINKAITEANGNIADAARRLETDRANLYRRMKRLRIGH
jgi:two-component system nitrogen regulation response regulator NtrX